MSSKKYLKDLFLKNYQIDKLKAETSDVFRQNLMRRMNSVSYGNFIDVTKQRGLSITFHWGHNHHFADDFILEGNMKERHIEIISTFVDSYNLPLDLTGKKILDIGVWTGGTCLMLAAMGAEVYGIEEVAQYAETVNYLAYAFGINDKIRCFPSSLYEFLPQFADMFDYIIYSGVIYHVTDPIISLRLVFNSLKDGGEVFLETLGNDSKETTCRYMGSSIHLMEASKNPSLKGWNYFIPSTSCLERWCYDAGFQVVNIGSCIDSRIKGAAKRTAFSDFCRAGISSINIR